MIKYRYEKVAATPYAKLLAEQRGVALSSVTAGADGVVRAADVLTAAESAGAGVGAAREASGRPSDGGVSHEVFGRTVGADASASRATPLARRIAAAKGIDLGSVQGSGRFGKILASDLSGAAGAAGFVRAAGADAEDVVTVVKMNGMRRTIAQRMARSARETAVVTQFMEMDVSDLLELRAIVNEGRPKGERITLTSFFVKAMAIAVREHERFRMQIQEEENAFLLHSAVNIGVAVGTDEGLSVPVLRGADGKTLGEINAEVSSLSQKARDGALSPDDYRGGVMTLSNMGMFGVTAFTPIINQPEASILGVGAPSERLVLEEDGVRTHSFVMQSLTYDHRIINGTEAAKFQLRVKDLIERPEQLI
jgi:pyruvate dehydrogenase E2 component (dihydrolipoamide acetyltransferase)